MHRLRRSLTTVPATTLRLAIIALAIHGALDLARDAIAQEEQQAYMPYAEQSGSLADRVAELEDLLVHFSREGDTVVVTGANLRVVNGTGSTNGQPNALGNVIVGYNEERDDGTDDRSGSHMLVVGARHKFTGFGGIVVGRWNSTTGDYSSVSGGEGNLASGFASSVSGGAGNIASGDWSSVSGGVGGEASGEGASLGGGFANEAVGRDSSVSGGTGNTAVGAFSSVSGGLDRAAPGDYNWAAGSLLEER